MSLDDIRPHIKQLSDTDIIVLLNEVSAEVKRRNTIMKGIIGSKGTVDRDVLRQSIQTVLEAMAGKPKV